MEILTAARSGSGLRGASRYLLLGGLLAGAVIVGLVTMHTVSLHGTPAAHAAAAAAARVSSTVSSTEPGAGDHEPAGHAGAACVGCGADGSLDMAMVCTLALLLVLVVLVPPRLLSRWTHTPPRRTPFARLLARTLARAPSLHLLCISRT